MLKKDERMQHTIAASFSFSGVGLHSGLMISCAIHPSAENSGIIFERDGVCIKISKDHIVHSPLCTSIIKEGLKFFTIEHLMSALSGMGVDNALVKLDGEEVPIMDGSAAVFCKMIEEVGLRKQSSARNYIKVLKPYIFQDGDKFIEITPFDGVEMKFDIEFGNKAIGEQSAFWDGKDYITNVAMARTYGFVEELEYMQSQGLAKGASLGNAIGISACGEILNPEGLRYHNEFAVHKLLDLIGDFFVVNMRFLGKIHAFKTSHTIHHKALMDFLSKENYYTII